MSRAVLRVTGPEQLPNAASQMLTFVPTESIVVIALGERQFAARYDTDEPMAVQDVIDAMNRHHVTEAIVVGFTERTSAVGLAGVLIEAAGIDVLEAVQAHDGFVTTSDGERLPYAQAALPTRDERLAAEGLDPALAHTFGTEPEVAQ